jgi:hypothetical protein
MFRAKRSSESAGIERRSSRWWKRPAGRSRCAGSARNASLFRAGHTQPVQGHRPAGRRRTAALYPGTEPVQDRKLQLLNRVQQGPGPGSRGPFKSVGNSSLPLPASPLSRLGPVPGPPALPPCPSFARSPAYPSVCPSPSPPPSRPRWQPALPLSPAVDGASSPGQPDLVRVGRRLSSYAGYHGGCPPWRASGASHA